VRSHTASARRRGIPDADLEALGQPARWPAAFSPAEIAALDLAARLVDHADDLGAELMGRLRQHYDDRQLAELVLVAGQANLNNRVGNAAKQLFTGDRR
jgi:alkylhydroperoxidase family enzyme